MFGNRAVSVGVLTCGLLLGATSVASAAPTLYRVTELGGLNGATSSIALSVNSSGQVIGSSIGADGARAVLWQPGGVPQDLGVFPGGDYTHGLGLNDAGQAVGVSGVRGFIWTSPNGLQDIGALPGSSFSVAYGINNAGQVVGSSPVANSYRAFIWEQGSGMQSLGVLPGKTNSEAIGINNAGQVVGYSFNYPGARAFLWQQGSGMQDLGVLPGYTSSFATEINDAGQVVGHSNGDNGLQAFIWSASGGMQALGSPPSGVQSATNSVASGINSFGDVVGWVGSYSDTSGRRASLWQDGQTYGLQDLLDPADPLSSIATLIEARGINDAGQIAGFGQFNGSMQAFLLTPVPEPSEWAMLLFGLALVGAAARHRKLQPGDELSAF